MAKWTFLTNHAVVLIFLFNHRKITARELAMEVGITERAVRKIIADLEAEGYIRKNREGNRVSYDINDQLPFRHHTQQDKAVGILLKGLQRKPRGKQKKRVGAIHELPLQGNER